VSDPILPDPVESSQAMHRSTAAWLSLSQRYAALLTLAVLTLATGLRMTLTPIWGSAYTFITYYPAITFIAVACGWRYGLGATLAAALLSTGLFLDGTFVLHEQGVAIAVFIAVNMVIVLLGEGVTRARRLAQAETALARTNEQRIRNEMHARAEVEAALRASQRQLQFVTDHAPILIAQCGADGSYRYVNQQYAAFFGRTPQALIGLHPQQVLGQTAYEQSAAFMQEALSGRTVKFDQQIVDTASLGHLLQVTFAPEFHEKGTVDGFIAVLVDITDRKHAEQARATLAAIVESSNDAIIGKDLRGVITSWNQGAERLFGYTAQEVIGQSVTVLIPSDRLAEEPPILDQIRRGKAIQNYETVRRCKDGTLRNVSLTVSPIRNDERQIAGVSSVARDMTERMRAEEGLRESEARYRATFDNAAVGIAHVGLDGRWLRFNDAICAITGYPRDVLLTKTFADITHPDDVEADWSEVRRLLAGEANTFSKEKRYIRQDGSLVWVNLTASLQRDAQGRPQNFISIIQDIQEQKEAQAQLLQLADDLEHRVIARTREVAVSQEKLRALTTDLHLAEHRVRQTLATDLHDYLAQLLVLSRIKLGQAKLEDVPTGVAEAMTEVQEVMDQALSYTRTLVAELSPPVLNEFGLPMAFKWLAEQMQQRGLTVSLELETTNVPLPEEPSVLLFQSVRELLMNILKHAGTPEATVGMRQAEGMLRITVSDQGAGYDLAAAETNLARGFGLFSIRERMKALGGGFELQSAPGQGTTATLLLPVAHSMLPSVELTDEPGWNSEGSNAPLDRVEAEMPPVSLAKSLPQPSAVRVLLVDDHLMLRQGLRTVVDGHPRLEVVGEAGDGLEAIDLARTLSPDVVVMDVNMPRCDGITATQRIKQEFPHIRVIALSMHNSSDMMERMKQAGASQYLTKESAAGQLCSAIVDTMSTGG
jgi:PAS domain S-box-containing protein